MKESIINQKQSASASVQLQRDSSVIDCTTSSRNFTFDENLAFANPQSRWERYSPFISHRCVPLPPYPAFHFTWYASSAMDLLAAFLAYYYNVSESVWSRSLKCASCACGPFSTSIIEKIEIWKFQHWSFKKIHTPKIEKLHPRMQSIFIF